jgi:Phage integrase central domain/Arm DNA-binding domain
MPDRRLITDRTLKALRPAPKGSRLEIWDIREPGFGVRVSDREDADPRRRGKAGKITFVLYGRFTTGAPPTRRVIGDYPGVSLEQARDTAGRWKSLVGKGVDPSIVEAGARAEAARVEALRNQANFGAIAETWLLDKVRKERRGKPVERVFRATFVTAWGERAITDITPRDVLAIINAKKRKAPEVARALLTMISRFFNWAIDQQVYGITSSPCDRLKATKLIGERTPRTRRLSDIELLAFWRATRRSDCPVCAAYRTLLLTALRLNEAVEMSWSEFADDSTVIRRAA